MALDALDETSFLQVQVWGLFLEAIAFGVYLTTCCSCYRVFWRGAAAGRDKRRPALLIKWLLLLVFLVLLAKASSSAVLHLVLNLRMVTAASHHDAAVQLSTGGSGINRSKYTTILIEAVIGSGFLLYRCYVLYKSFLVLLIPSALWVGGVTVMGIIISIDHMKHVNGVFDQQQIYEACFWGIIFTTNAIITGLISRQVLLASDLGKTRRMSRFRRIRNALIQSGMLYTIMSLITFSLFLANSLVVYAAIDVLVQVIAITFNLIVIHTATSCEVDLEACDGPEYDMPARTRTPQTLTRSFATSNFTGNYSNSDSFGTDSAIEFAFPKVFPPRVNANPGTKNAHRTSSAAVHSEEQDLPQVGRCDGPPAASQNQSQLQTHMSAESI
ncbi:hypothetical protein C8F01DRAFT_1376098 [Mycena amicta]|nr:hypothetical protein C8F01DRAFT_1376098 [Mycena amicta]